MGRAMKINFVTDSTTDVPPEFVERYNIRVVPTLVVFEGKEYRDGVDITRAEFYQRLPSLRPLPTTAAPSAGDFESIFASIDGPVISLHTAVSLTAIYTSARIASEKFADRVTVIDSGSISLGAGWQVVAAAAAAAAGANVQEVLKVIADVRKRVRVFALLDTLDNLRHSGRISLMRASIGELLQIKPMVEVYESQLIARDQFRTRAKALPSFIEQMKSLGKFERLGVLYTDNIEPAKQVHAALGDHAPAGTIVSPITSTVGTHIGLNAVGVTGVLRA
jgi:DegV family protein with EDD domain